MSEWTTRLRLDPRNLRLLVTTEEEDILRARLPLRPKSPRALLTILEGIALWSGREITVATSVDASWDPSADADLFGGGFWPAETNLVRYQILPRRVPCRIRGVGDFRKLYRIPKLRGGA
jgi:hypothetical protein